MEQNPHQHTENHVNHMHHGEKKTVQSEISIQANYENGKITLNISDSDGNPPVLGVSHEKMIHLIVVSNDLGEFFHLHPRQINEYEFVADITLTSFAYSLFVDIKPEGKNYLIEPIRLAMNSDLVSINMNEILENDSNLRKEINGKVVELAITKPIKTDEPITLTFDLEGETPELYLGSLGHVVIIDQKVEQFIHVHPISNKDTVFQTQFEKPGVYKLWAEFKFDGTVSAFPYVLEVKKEG